MEDNILRWAGSKHALADWLMTKMPVHKTYVEPFAGGLNMFLCKSPSAEVNILNDINGNLVNLYKVLKDDNARRILVDEMSLMFHSRDLFNEFLRLYRTGYFKYMNGIYQAAIFLYLNRVSFGGKMDSYSPEGYDSSINIEKLDKVSRKIFRKLNYNVVVIENKHFREIIPKYDKEGTLIYCDPPYLTTLEKGKMKYEFTMPKEEHYELRDACYRLVFANYLVSYDDNPLIHEMWKDAPYMMETPVINWSLGNKSSDENMRKEVVFANYPLKNINTLFEEEDYKSIEGVKDGDTV